MTNSSDSSDSGIPCTLHGEPLEDVLCRFFRNEVPPQLARPFDPEARRAARLQESVEAPAPARPAFSTQPVMVSRPDLAPAPVKGAAVSGAAVNGGRRLVVLSAVSGLAACLLFLTSITQPRGTFSGSDSGQVAGSVTPGELPGEMMGNAAGVLSNAPETLMPVSESGLPAAMPVTLDGTTLHEIQSIDIKPRPPAPR